MIRELLNEYKEITKSIIENINSDKEALILIEKREDILKEIFSNENNIDEIKEVYLDMNLLDLDERLQKEILKEKSIVKEQMKSVHKRKSANNAYEKNKMVNKFFSTKI